MLTGNQYLHAFASRPTWFFAPDDGGGDGDAAGDGDGDDDSGDEDDADDDSGGGDAAGDGDDKDPKAEAEKWKKLARKHEDRAKANARAAKELEELKNKNLPDNERALTEAEQRGRTAAAAEYAQQLAGARIEAALTGVVDDPADVVDDLNLAKYVTDDNEIDADAIDELKTKWQARMGSRNDGEDGDGAKPKPKADLKQGKRGKNGAGGPEQLTRDALKSMTSEQIEAARLAGQLNDVLGIKT